MSQVLRIWCNMTWPEAVLAALRAGIEGHELVMASTLHTSILQPNREDPKLAEADVAFGQPDAQQLLSLPRLKFVQLPSAGYERYASESFRQKFRQNGAVMCNSSSVYAEPCAEHALAMILGLARQLPQAMAVQVRERDWPSQQIRLNSPLLVGQSVLILSYGQIARRLIELLRPLGMEMAVMRRWVRGDEGVRAVGEARLEDELGKADHVINILPGGAETWHYMNGKRFGRMKRGAIFYNIGRGTTVDQEALVAALNSGHLGAAYLDVTHPEPLPADHPLWTARNCFVTPHTAGGHATELPRLVGHFVENFQRFVKGEALVDQII